MSNRAVCGTEEHFTTECNHACVQNKVGKNLYRIFVFIIDGFSQSQHLQDCFAVLFSVSCNKVFFPAGGHIILYIKVM